MGKTKLIVYMEKSILSSIEKEAISEGKSKSEIAADLIASALGSRSGSERGGSGVPPEALRFLVADVAKTADLLRQISRLLSAEKFKDHEERVRIAEKKSDRILKKLNLDAIEDVDRFVMGAMSKEETDQMLKEMGIIGEDGKIIETGGEKNERLSGLRQSEQWRRNRSGPRRNSGRNRNVFARDPGMVGGGILAVGAGAWGMWSFYEYSKNVGEVKMSEFMRANDFTERMNCDLPGWKKQWVGAGKEKKLACYPHPDKSGYQSGWEIIP